MPFPSPSTKFSRIPTSGPLDEISYPGRMERSKLQMLQNGVYRRIGSVGKRTGNGPYAGAGAVGSAAGIISGTRWYRGKPSTLAKMLVQSADKLWVGNDGTGAFTALTPSLSVNSTPAFFASSYDPALTSDILIVAYGSGPPMRWDGTTFAQLNGGITNPFKGTHFWHEHVWFWGDAANPDTVFATDLGNPESMAFSQAFGGYQIGRGDGDPNVQRVISVGDTNYVFKTRGIQAIRGYDFQSGEYQFTVTPISSTLGIPSPNCVARLRNTLIFWSGQNFYALYPGAEEPMPLGSAITNDIATAAAGNQSVVRCVAGDFLVQGPSGPIVYNDVFLCAVDDGSGTAQKILMYDDYASQLLSAPCWAVWSGLRIGAWIPWGGPGDQKILYWGDATASQVNFLGQNALADSGQPIAFVLKTIRDDTGTPDQRKHINNLYLECEANAATFAVTVESDLAATPVIEQAQAPPAVGSAFGTAVFGTSQFGSASPTVYQAPFAPVAPEVFGHNFTMTLTERSNTALYEIISLTGVYYEDALPQT